MTAMDSLSAAQARETIGAASVTAPVAASVDRCVLRVIGIVPPHRDLLWARAQIGWGPERSQGALGRRLTDQCPKTASDSASPPSAQKTTMSQGGAFHMNSSRKAATAIAKTRRVLRLGCRPLRPRVAL